MTTAALDSEADDRDPKTPNQLNADQDLRSRRREKINDLLVESLDAPNALAANLGAMMTDLMHLASEFTDAFVAAHERVRRLAGATRRDQAWRLKWRKALRKLRKAVRVELIAPLVQEAVSHTDPIRRNELLALADVFELLHNSAPTAHNAVGQYGLDSMETSVEITREVGHLLKLSQLAFRCGRPMFSAAGKKQSFGKMVHGFKLVRAEPIRHRCPEA